LKLNGIDGGRESFGHLAYEETLCERISCLAVEKSIRNLTATSISLSFALLGNGKAVDLNQLVHEATGRFT
jgi:hypothetical protein